MNKQKRKAVIAGNWKMNNTPTEAGLLLEALIPGVHDADCEVVVCVPFTDLKTGREIFVVRRMPKPAGITGRYHCHPHPRFTLSDRYVVYTTTLRNRADVAVTPVEPLLETLRK